MQHFARFEVIRLHDPALDLDAMGSFQGSQLWQDFVATRDPSLAICLEGQSPVVFHCRALTIKERRELRGKATLSDQCERAFALCVQRVDNMLFPDGSRRAWIRSSDKPLSDTELDELFSESDVQHVGNVIYTLSFLAKDAPRYVPVRAICQDAMIAAALAWRRHRAEQTSPPVATSE